MRNEIAKLLQPLLFNAVEDLLERLQTELGNILTVAESETEAEGRPRPDIPRALPTYYVWARQYIGTREVPGPQSNALILRWLKDAFSWAKDDSTLAWCGIFVMQAMKATGNPYVQGYAGARKWLEWGMEVDEPLEGDVVVLWRESPSSWKGHVGFFVRREGSHIVILGGNQDDSVSEEKYPVARVLGYRRLP